MPYARCKHRRPRPRIATLSTDALAAQRGQPAVQTGQKAEVKLPARVRALPPSQALGAGTADPQAIARVVRRRIGQIRSCYERGLRRQPQLAGKLLVEMTITPSGRVGSARLLQDGLGGGYVGRCVTEKLRRFRFPAPQGGSVTVRHPFVFSSKG